MKRILRLLLALTACAHVVPPAGSVTVTDFGHGSMRINNVLPIGTRPLLVIVANFVGSPSMATNDWESLIFGQNFAGTRVNLVDYYREVSNGRFTWSRAGKLDVDFTEAERNSINTRDSMIRESVTRKGLDLAILDKNHDLTVSAEELSILVIHNLGDASGQTSGIDVNVPSASLGRSLRVNVGASSVAHRDSFMTFCHEIGHTLGPVDLYGKDGEGLHGGVTLMGPTIPGPTDYDNRRTYHLDPWHKMKLGWSEPRIVSLRSKGRTTIPATQLKRADAPVLFFDPLRGTDEFFLLEYRTNNSPLGAGYDANVASSGLLIWHVWQNADHTPVLAAPDLSRDYPTQGQWKTCEKCAGMYFGPGQASSHCPQGETHTTPSGWANYWLVMDTPTAPGQSGWRWCHKCQGLFFSDNLLPTRCPADNGTHDENLGSNYSLRRTGETIIGKQNGWRWCRNCQGAFYGGASLAAGRCPASTGAHDGNGSSEYSMHTDLYGVMTEGSQVENGVDGLTSSVAWSPGSVIPYLRWFSDSSEPSIPVLYQPKEFVNQGNELLLEWNSQLAPPPFSGEAWVDYSLAFSGNGTLQSPYNSLRQAVDLSPFYTRIKIKPGSGNERITIRQSVLLEAPLGPVTIGQ